MEFRILGPLEVHGESRRGGVGRGQAAGGAGGVAAARQRAGQRRAAGGGAVGRGGAGGRGQDGAGVRVAVAQGARATRRADRDHAGGLPAAGAPGRARRRALRARRARPGGARWPPGRPSGRRRCCARRWGCGAGRRWRSWSSSRSRRRRSRGWRSSGWRRWRRAWRPIWPPAGTPSWSASCSSWWPSTRRASGCTAQLMLALYRSGRQAEALEAYRRRRASVLVEAARDRAGPELRQLHRAILAQDRRARRRPGARALGCGAARARCRRRRTGRSAARARSARSWSACGPAQSRLLTLTGPGGVGKTRLALEAARAVEADFADGAGFVRLAAVGRPQDVPGAIIAALAIVPLEGESPADAVERFLAVKHLLLVVDNCEHLPDAAPLIGALVAACPDLTVLATSREPLSVQAEQTHPVPPLALPAGRDAPGGAGRCRGRRAVLRARASARPGLPPRRGQRRRGRRDLPARRRAAAGDRAGGRALRVALTRGDRRAPRRRGRRAGRRAARRAGPPADVARDDRLEPRAAERARNGTASRASRCSPAARRVEAAEAITGAGIDTLDRLVAKSLLVRRRRRRTHPAGHAGDHPRLRRRALRRARGQRRRPRAPSSLLPRARPAPRDRPGAHAARAARSISPGSTPRPGTSPRRSSGRPHRTPPPRCSSCVPPWSSTGSSASATRTRSSGSTAPSAGRVATRRCGRTA